MNQCWLIEAEGCIYALATLAIIGSDNGLSPVQCQAIIWTNAEILSIRPLGTNFIEILIKIQTFPFKEMHLKKSSANKWRPFCLSLNVLIKPLGTNICEIWTKKQKFSFKEIHLNLPSAKCWSFCSLLCVFLAKCRRSVLDSVVLMCEVVGI